MGKYQLDYKGMQQVERYQWKNATVKNDKARVQALLESWKEEGQILRRPSQTDKEAILDDGWIWKGRCCLMVDLGNANNFVYEEWLEENRQAGVQYSENWVQVSSWLVLTKQASSAFQPSSPIKWLLLGKARPATHPSIRTWKGLCERISPSRLQIAKEKNNHRVLVTCSIKNPASQVAILANGGQLEDIRHETERCW